MSEEQIRQKIIAGLETYTTYVDAEIAIRILLELVDDIRREAYKAGLNKTDSMKDY